MHKGKDRSVVSRMITKSKIPFIDYSNSFQIHDQTHISRGQILENVYMQTFQIQNLSMYFCDCMMCVSTPFWMCLRRIECLCMYIRMYIYINVHIRVLFHVDTHM